MSQTILRKAGQEYSVGSAYNVPKQWEIWIADQTGSRAATIPPVPGDPTKDHRAFVIISPSKANSNGSEVVCMPLSTKSFQKTFEVILDASGVPGRYPLEQSFVKCFQPQSLNTEFLYGPAGFVADAQKREDIQELLQDYLGIPT